MPQAAVGPHPCWRGTDSSATRDSVVPHSLNCTECAMVLTPLLSAELSKTTQFSLALVGEHAQKHAAPPAHLGEGNANRQRLVAFPMEAWKQKETYLATLEAQGTQVGGRRNVCHSPRWSLLQTIANIPSWVRPLFTIYISVTEGISVPNSLANKNTVCCSWCTLACYTNIDMSRVIHPLTAPQHITTLVAEQVHHSAQLMPLCANLQTVSHSTANQASHSAANYRDR